MARKHYGFDEKKIAAFLKQGRGEGSGASYKPWLKVSDVPSDGRSHRPYGTTTGRTHHLLSDIEYRAFVLFDWAPAVYDIREQFPLDRARTQEIADALGVLHPKDLESHVPIVMTTDFVVDFSVSGRQVTRAYAVKPASELEKPTIVRKLDIERKYWVDQNIEWSLITELDLPMVAFRNIDWIRSYHSLDGQNDLVEGGPDGMIYAILRRLDTSSEPTIISFCSSIDKSFDAPSGTSLLLIRHLLATRRIELPIDVAIDPQTHLDVLRDRNVKQAVSA